MDVVTGAVVKDVVTGALGSLISKLGQLLSKEYKLQKNAREKLESLIEELKCAQAALHKVGGVPPDQLDDLVRIWAREVRDASYDMEDEIDSFLVRVDGSHQHSVDQESFFKRLCDFKPRKLFEPLMPRKLLERRKISDAMDEINKRLEKITQRHGRYSVSDSITIARPANIDPRLAAMYKEVTELVGIEESSSELTAMLSTMKMVSVVGVGGLGKTTLAKSVYDKLKVEFECSAFVPVGRNPDMKKVLQDILREIDKEEYKKHVQFYKESSEKQLIDDLRETFLGNKRYLLIIDDVWETKSWETIKLALVQKNSESRVITTTRILEVAKEAGEVYKLQQLPDGKSKKLFYTRIFGAAGKCLDNQLDEVSDKILKKCGGVPLAIITMASLLVGKSREEWIEVGSSIAFRDKDNKQVSDTEWILSLSYYDLPPHLKTCLLYLSVFPEDQIIHKDSLIGMWIAEGFVHKDKPGTSLFEVGNGYFNELINRSMIQAVESIEDDMVVGCRVHDMVLDLLCLKSQEENFVTILSNNDEATSSSSRLRRLAYRNQKKVMELSQMELGHVRSFIACRCNFYYRFSFQSFKLLRVLAFESCDVFLNHLESLPHLRYLGLGYSYINGIPEKIGTLQFLQTLEMKGAYFSRALLPSSVGLLTQLMCLRARHMTVLNGVIEKLTSLEQLEISANKNTSGHTVTELGKLHELRVLYAGLGVLDHSTERDLVKSLENLHKIWHLELSYSISGNASMLWETVALPRPLRRFIVSKVCFSELPSCICPSDLPNLTYLDLTLADLKDQHLKMLGQLPELRHLKLKILWWPCYPKVTVNSTVSTSTSTSTDGCFQKLISMSLLHSTVRFVLEEDSSVSFCVSEPKDYATIKRETCIVAPAILPNLQVLELMVYVDDNVHKGVVDNLGLDCLPSLQRVKVTLSASPFISSADDVRREQAALRQEIEGHPNQPRLQIILPS